MQVTYYHLLALGSVLQKGHIWALGSVLQKGHSWALGLVLQKGRTTSHRDTTAYAKIRQTYLELKCYITNGL